MHKTFNVTRSYIFGTQELTFDLSYLQQRVSFHNTGPSWVCGVIVMSIEDGHDGFPGLSQLDPMYVKKSFVIFSFKDLHPLVLLTNGVGRYSFIVVVVNASPKEVSFVSPALQSRSLQLHPIQVQIKLKNLNDEKLNISRLCLSCNSFKWPFFMFII